MTNRGSWLALVLVLVVVFTGGGSVAATASPPPLPVRVMVITMFDSPTGTPDGEAARWTARENLTTVIPVPGLPEGFPAVRCDNRQMCVMTTGPGESNAAVSMTAVVRSRLFDFRSTYFLVAGIAGIDPTEGTLGTAAWANYAVDGGLAHEIDAREMPSDWSTGYFALGSRKPGQPATFKTGTEVFALDENLASAAASITHDIPLADSDRAREIRQNYPQLPARAGPSVVRCDTMTTNEYWTGPLLSHRAHAWVDQLTEGRGKYCTTQEEDNATLTALLRASHDSLLDGRRIAILRTASNFDQAHPGQPAVDGLSHTAGFPLALENAYRVGSGFAHHVLADWPHWRLGVPEHP